MATKLYKNMGKEKLNVIGVGELEPGEQISLTGQYLPVVIMENYPGLVDLTDVETTPVEEKQATQKPTANPVAGEEVQNG